MINKDLRATDLTVFYNKLDFLLQNLKVQYQNGTFQTQEDVVEEFRSVLHTFYTTLTAPFLKLRPVVAGTSPLYTSYNQSFTELGSDLSINFQELQTLETIIMRNFNCTISQRDQLIKLIKRISSKAGDYVLYSTDPIGNTVYFKDSFNDVSKIDFGSSLLTALQCEVDTTEGVVTLPLTKTNTPLSVTSNIQINQSSNGSIGNYQEIGAARHDDVRDVLDSNADTWFEYERVQNTREENTNPLVLDVTLYFDNLSIINFVRINPNNFGTQTPVQINTIETSTDGNIFLSIKDDIAISGFLQEDEDNVFLLAPSTSKYTGQGLYTFTPRKVKYVHINFSQTTPYLINTPAGQKWRYAIGIRDIELQAVKYETTGDLISTAFSNGVEIQKVSLLASENPTEKSELADVKHQISPDDGATWYDIQPQNRTGTTTPEIVSFNTGDTGSIATPTPVLSMRHRVLLNRYPDAFKAGATSLSSIEKDGVDILGLPALSPPKMQLTRIPIPGTVKLMNPLYASRALDGKTVLETIDGKQQISLPVKLIVGRSSGQPNQIFSGILDQEIRSGMVSIHTEIGTPNIDYNEMVVWIDNDNTWARVGTFTSNDKQYMISNDGTLSFGSYDIVAETGTGRIPSAGSVISIVLKEEPLALSSAAPYSADLVFPTDGDKQNTHIYRYDPAVVAPSFRLKPGEKVIRLPHNLIQTTITFAGKETSDDIKFDDIFKTEIAFVNGSSELATQGYSVDRPNGIIYSYDGVPLTATNWVVNYSYIPRIELTSADWDFIPDPQFNRIQIYDSGYKDIVTTGFALTAGQICSKLKNNAGARVQGVISGSLVFSSTSPFDSGVLPHEVAYVDGTSEFSKLDAQINLDGYFSVDYKNGIIYVSPSDKFETGMTVNFRYTDFKVCYNISKFLSPSSYKVEGQIVNIQEREILKYWTNMDRDLKNSNLLKAIYDYVSTTRESIEELEPYFTPIVRDVVFKVLPVA